MLNLPNAITLTRIALVVVFTAAVSVADLRNFSANIYWTRG